MWRIIAMALTAVIVIVIVVVVAVVVTNHKNNNQASNSGSHAVSKYANLTRMTTYDSPDIQNKKRIFVVGDIHGCVSELNSLVDQIKYNSQDDLLILAGDLVDRGPDSLGVIRRAQELGALCVRGNHDDKVVRLKTFELQNGQAALQSGKGTMPEGPVADPLKFSNHHAAIALAMSQEEYNYLAACPMILRLPWLSNSVVVHGGLDPTKDLESQDPYSVMNMRDIADGVPNPSSDQGVHWGTAFNSAQLNTSNVMYVYYGHDAGRGLNLQKYTKGVDTGCVYGRKLTALEMRSQQLTQVSCSKYA
ncbi:Metallo-dependent phosphatase-like protein [Radiomyces spectabilis]|uniref:Metallo-dependent phosphatase-like protein n=1 Tax=Radiomyces spectabilis TaxID=64574 RepID=UPI00221EE3C9|nr:Metallo-dependent phosphatase-like protein [Radiomyces spectabilis]KAI8374261.1 Metallo-dependent phosphatase-like protein [Radiomyces spectabilis]